MNTTPLHRTSTLRRCCAGRRNGATTVESAVVLGICLVILLGMMELSIVIVRYGMVADATRRVARAAITRGSLAPNSMGSWGPMEVEIAADDDSDMASFARPSLAAVEPADVQIRLSWPDGDNAPGDRVQVEIRYEHHPIVSIPVWYSQVEIQAASTMRIAH